MDPKNKKTQKGFFRTKSLKKSFSNYDKAKSFKSQYNTKCK